MDLYLFTILLFALFAGGYSLNCYQCANVTSCVGVATTCFPTLTACASLTVVASVGNTVVTSNIKGCNSPLSCGNGSLNVGIARAAVSMQCCNTDLCNTQDVPDSSSVTPNGKQCYYCDGNSCINKLNCSGTEDYCIKATANIAPLPSTVKGCVSKSFCDVSSLVPAGFGNVSCCQGNLCNGAKSITQNLLYFFWLFFFYTLFH